MTLNWIHVSPTERMANIDNDQFFHAFENSVGGVTLDLNRVTVRTPCPNGVTMRSQVCQSYEEAYKVADSWIVK